MSENNSIIKRNKRGRLVLSESKTRKSMRQQYLEEQGYDVEDEELEPVAVRLEESLKEMQLIRQGKKKARTWDEFYEELKKEFPEIEQE